MFEIRTDDMTGEAQRALLALHLAGMFDSSPPDQVFALDLSGLTAPNITVWTVWAGQDLAGIGALKTLSADVGELKSMRTDPRYLRRRVASTLLDFIIAQARARGLRRLSLETGRGAAFEPALALYRRRGFASGPAFADYPGGEFSQFLHLDL